MRWFDGVVPALPAPAESTGCSPDAASAATSRPSLGRAFGAARPNSSARGVAGRTGRRPDGDHRHRRRRKVCARGPFRADLPPPTLLLWLDFDRADLAPDDAVSVLRSCTTSWRRAGRPESPVSTTSRNRRWSSGCSARLSHPAFAARRARCSCSTASRSRNTPSTTQRSGICSSRSSAASRARAFWSAAAPRSAT